jgi:transketolase C-terminal domain/subunit
MKFPSIVRLGITEEQFSKIGSREEIRAYYEIDQNGIMETVQYMLKDFEVGQNRTPKDGIS